MILMIDNYDSFTFNIVQYLGELGADVLVKRNDEISIDEIKTLNPERIVISPGPCTPNEAGVSLEVVKNFCEYKPILGVCLGHQTIGQAFGGKIVSAKKIMHGKTSKIIHDGDYLFNNIQQKFIATRYHSLVIDPDSLPDSLIITARTVDSDDQSEIMGVRHKDYKLFGVQFHPESILTESGHKLLENFINV
ncbi:MAG: aminodeoxychorismate/anthranilate synthase component II [Pseudomonadota bacterium]|nr:aminodeoxychorismate/anthranilate synthase component II [Pseudomonadota bacterium]